MERFVCVGSKFIIFYIYTVSSKAKFHLTCLQRYIYHHNYKAFLELLWPVYLYCILPLLILYRLYDATGHFSVMCLCIDRFWSRFTSNDRLTVIVSACKKYISIFPSIIFDTRNMTSVFPLFLCSLLGVIQHSLLVSKEMYNTGHTCDPCGTPNGSQLQLIMYFQTKYVYFINMNPTMAYVSNYYYISSSVRSRGFNDQLYIKRRWQTMSTSRGHLFVIHS